MTGIAMDSVTLSVVIPSHDRRDSVLRLLAALRAQAAGEEGLSSDRFEVIVVADGCTDDTVARLQRSVSEGEWPFALSIVEHSPGRGASAARNAGAARARGALLLFVDDDIEPFPTMLATHAAMHAEAAARGDWLVVIGAPVPVRPAEASTHEIAAWGWWEQQFERMGAPGHRFTYDEVFTGVLSVPASHFREVGGFDTTLGDCHEDSELGLRLFRAGARAAFTRRGGGLHHEIRDMHRLLPRKWAEGRADVRIARRWPEIVGYLTLAGRAKYPAGILGVLRWRAFTLRALSGVTSRIALPVLGWLDRHKLRGTWRRLHGALLAQGYWRGVAAEVGTESALQQLVASGHDGWVRWSAHTHHLDIDLDDGLDAAERRLDAERPHALTIHLGEFPVGEVQLLPTAERLHGGHLRRILATALGQPLGVALALRSARTALPVAPPPVQISVVIPAWNAADTIARALESLLAQTMPHWNAIVVDDGSTDGTAGIVRDYAARDARIRLIQQQHAGVGAARNAGLRHASHDWLHLLDADDWMAPTAFERFASAVIADPSLDAVHCAWARVTVDGYTILERRCWEVGDLFKAFAVQRAFVVHACLVRRAAVEAVGGFDPSRRVASDWVMWQRLARRGAVFGAIPDVLAYYTHRVDALSNDPLSLLEASLSTIALGHGPDAAVPTGIHADGRPAHELAEAQLACACWIAGMRIARGDDAVGLLEHVPRPSTVPPPIVVADSLYRAVPNSLGTPPAEWPQWWPRVEQGLVPFLDALERHTGVAGYARAIRVALERRVAAHAGASDLVLGMTDVRACEITAPITDLAAAEGAERIALTVLVQGESLGMVELPVVDGRVRAVVARDAIADAFAWPILGRFFEGSLYRSVEFREGHSGCSAWQDGVELATGLPPDGRARADALHDVAGWDVFQREVWGVRRDRWTPERRAPVVDGWASIEVSDPPTGVSAGPGSTNVVLQVGGVSIAVVSLREDDGALGSAALRTRLTDAVGFEMCRAAVREALLGVPWDAGERLCDLLARRAGRGGDAVVVDGTLPPPGSSMAPDWHRQVQFLDPTGHASIFVGRRAGRFLGGSGSRVYAVPAGHARTLVALEQAVGTPCVERDAPAPAGALYAPSVFWRPSQRVAGHVSPAVPSPTVAPWAPRRDASDEDEAEPPRVAPSSDRRLPILMYHRVAPDGAPMRRRWRVTPEAFDAQMHALRRLGYRTTTLAEWQHAVDTNRVLQGRPVLLTFDDGYADLAEYAWPILRRHELQALALVVTGSVGRWNTWDVGGESEPLLDWPALRELRDEGMEFGAHSVSHRRMTGLGIADAFAEALHSRRQLHEELGVAADTFAYPFGNEDPVQRSLIGAAGFQFGLSVRSGAAGRNAPWLSLPRIEVTGDDDLASFEAKLQG